MARRWFRIIAFACSISGCGRIGFEPAGSDGDPLAGYHATAVHFARATNSYIWASSLANAPNSRRGTMSVWLRFHGGDGVTQTAAGPLTPLGGGLTRTASNQFYLKGYNCLGVPGVDLYSQRTYMSTSGWLNVLVSWDVAIGRLQFYVNDVADTATSSTATDSGDICYGPFQWGVGGRSFGELDADVADVYITLTRSIDLSSEANRRAFISAAGKPVDLGPTCNNVPGTAATICLTGGLAQWHINKGNGGGFAVGGSPLTLASTSPSD